MKKAFWSRRLRVQRTEFKLGRWEQYDVKPDNAIAAFSCVRRCSKCNQYKQVAGGKGGRGKPFKCKACVAAL